MNQLDNSIDPQVQQSLEQLRAVLARHPKAAARGRAQFLAQAKAWRAPVSAQPLRRHIGWKNFIRKERFTMTILMTIVAIVALVLGGTGMAVYAAQDDLPTEALYPVKIFSEDVRLGLAMAPEAQVELSLALANRRVEEVSALGAGGIVPPDQVAVRLQAHVENALHVAAGMEDAAMQGALAQIRATLEQQTQRMSMVQASAPEPVQPALARVQTMLTARHGLAQLGLTDPLAFRERAQIRLMLGAPVTPTHTMGGGWGPGPGISQTVAPGGGWGPGPGISQTVAPGGGYGPGPQITPTHTGGSPQPPPGSGGSHP